MSESVPCPGKLSEEGQKEKHGLQDQGWLKKGIFLQSLALFDFQHLFFPARGSGTGDGHICSQRERGLTGASYSNYFPKA